MLRDLGAFVIDADEGARAVVEPGTSGFERVLAEFGPGVVSDGRLDRAALAALVFADRQALDRLNGIVHPLVRDWTALRLQEAAALGHQLVVEDIPLLFENELQGMFEAIILVHVPPALQLQRATSRGVPAADASARIRNQIPIDSKIARSSHVIDNSGPLEATRAQVEKAWTEITASRLSGP